MQEHGQEQSHDTEQISSNAEWSTSLQFVREVANGNRNDTGSDADWCGEEIGLEAAPAKGREDGRCEDGDGVRGHADAEVQYAGCEDLPVFEGVESTLESHLVVLAAGLLRICLQFSEQPGLLFGLEEGRVMGEWRNEEESKDSGGAGHGAFDKKDPAPA